MKLPQPRSKGEETFALHVRANGLLPPRREFEFALPRKFRFDFAWPEHLLAVEIEGGGHHSRHRGRDGFARDAIKYNLAAINGWCVLRYTSSMVHDGTAIAQVADVLRARVGDGWIEPPPAPRIRYTTRDGEIVYANHEIAESLGGVWVIDIDKDAAVENVLECNAEAGWCVVQSRLTAERIFVEGNYRIERA